jgi:site-specific DNA-adenine methylase
MATKCPVSLPPLIRWPGGKARMAKRLAKLMPKHSTYVEPFAGGASVFFHKPLAKRSVIGDADKWLIQLYQDTRTGKLRSCEGGIRASKSLFKRSLKNKSACHKVALSALSYHGDRKTYGAVSQEGRVILANKLAKADCYQGKLRRAILRNSDFASTMRKYDARDTVHFLDPPWVMDYSDKYHAHGGARRGKSKDKRSFAGAMDPKKVRAVCDKMRGTVIVIYNWTPEIARTFKGPGWRVMKVSATTQHGRGGLVKRPNMIAIKKARRA